MGQFTFPQDPTGGTITHKLEEVKGLKPAPSKPLDYLHNFVVEFNNAYRDTLWLQASLDHFNATSESNKIEMYATVYVSALFNRKNIRLLELHLPNGDAFPVHLGVYTSSGTKWKFKSVNESIIEYTLYQLIEDEDVKRALSSLARSD